MSKKEERRPEIPNLILDTTKDAEHFQNKALRPILKMQHSLLIAFFQDYLEKRKVSFSGLQPMQQENYIDTVLSKDITYKNQQLGLIIGQLTIEEYAVYRTNSSEFNKRILQMLKKRLKDSIQDITQ